MHIVIIGNGISGITAARHIRKMSRHRITVISSETEHFYARTALMYVYMGHMRYQDTKPYADDFWEQNNIELIYGHVEKIDFVAKQLKFAERGGLIFDKLIIATGSKPKKLGIPGEDLQGVQGLYHWQDLTLMEKHTKTLPQRAVVVGGGLIGVEMAEMLLSRNIPCTMLVKERSFYGGVLPAEESFMVNQHIKKHGVDLHNETLVVAIKGDAQGNVQAVVTNTGAEIACQFVGITIGVEPNIDFLADSPVACNYGVLVNHKFETNVPDVYAIGDCAEIQDPTPGRKPIEALWYTGRMMGETIAYVICGKKEVYQPGIWFNSAKFFDLEYQVYGFVPNTEQPDCAALFWQNAQGNKSIRLVYDKNTQKILGFNLMGIRYRQEVCERWIKLASPVTEVLQDLSLANFDPELSKQYEQKLIDQYNRQQGTNLSLRRKRSLDQVLQFLGLKNS